MKLLLILPLLIFLACQEKKTQSVFMPDNDLADRGINSGNLAVDEELFNTLIDEVANVYEPIIRDHGGNLFINRLWTDPTVNASAVQFDDGSWIVNMFGGLARRQEVTADGFVLVLCHEIGHHLAGYPFVVDWAANEGSSDYYSVLGCARHLWQNKAATLGLNAIEVPVRLRELCDAIWTYPNERKLCYRTMLAGKSTASLLAALQRKTVDFSRQDNNIVETTNNDHPNAQCRLDTFMAASLCMFEWDHTIIPGKSFTDRNSREAEREAANVSCSRFFERDGSALEDIEQGYRPNCWFKPKL